MNNELKEFEQHHLKRFEKLAEVVKSKKALEALEKKIKGELEEAMNAYDIKTIDNQFMKVTNVNGSTTTSIDLAELKKKEPDLFEELITDYPKTTVKASYLTFKVK